MKIELIVMSFFLLLAWPWPVRAANPSSMEAERSNSESTLEGKTPLLSSFPVPKINPRHTHAVAARDNRPKPAPDFKFKKGDESVSFKDEFKGKVVLLDFWFIDCPWCMRSTPLLHELSEKYGEKGLVVVGMNVDDTERERAEKYVQKEISAKGHQALYEMKDVAQRYGVKGYPHFVLIGPDGTILARGGYSELKNKVFDPKIETALKKTEDENLPEK